MPPRPLLWAPWATGSGRALGRAQVPVDDFFASEGYMRWKYFREADLISLYTSDRAMSVHLVTP